MQEKIQSVRAKDAEAMLEADAELARSIIMESMLTSPYFGGAGAVLSIVATPILLSSSSSSGVPGAATGAGSTTDQSLHNHLREIDEATPPRYSFQIVEQQQQQHNNNNSNHSSSSSSMAAQAIVDFVHNQLPVHLVVYLYAAAPPAASNNNSSGRRRHITTLEFLMLSVDDFTYAMRERQVMMMLVH